jgi:uncharacterized membrane protein/nitrite reductase/ring-hydroxylating ferredoxin subunit
MNKSGKAERKRNPAETSEQRLFERDDAPVTVEDREIEEKKDQNGGVENDPEAYVHAADRMPTDAAEAMSQTALSFSSLMRAIRNETGEKWKRTKYRRQSSREHFISEGPAFEASLAKQNALTLSRHFYGEYSMRSKAAISSHPIHPILVAFPIALWVIAFIFDLIAVAQANPSLWAAGFYCVIAGCVGAALAAVPGALDWYAVVPPKSSAKQRGLIHGSLNVVALLLFIAVAYRQGSPAAQPDGLNLVLMAIGVVLIGISGWLGGTLVYRNQIGVDHRYAGAGKLKERTLSGWDRPVCNQSELGDGQMLLAIVGQDRVVIGRCSEGLFAFSDHCTHRGGPLSDGALVDCTVQCPWHGSQFDIRTGRVVSGPAEEKIEVHKAEIRAGEVYIEMEPSDAQPKPQAA